MSYAVKVGIKNFSYQNRTGFIWFLTQTLYKLNKIFSNNLLLVCSLELSQLIIPKSFRFYNHSKQETH